MVFLMAITVFYRFKAEGKKSNITTWKLFFKPSPTIVHVHRNLQGDLDTIMLAPYF